MIIITFQNLHENANSEIRGLRSCVRTPTVVVIMKVLQFYRVLNIYESEECLGNCPDNLLAEPPLND